MFCEPCQLAAHLRYLSGFVSHRNGCKDGTIPHVRSGQTYYIDVSALLKQLRGSVPTEVNAVQATDRCECSPFLLGLFGDGGETFWPVSD